MTGSYERGTELSPVDRFARDVRTGEPEADFLLDGLEAGLELLTDMDAVNERLAASERPDLVVTAPAEQMELDWPVNHRKINNFIPRLRGFGLEAYKMGKTWSRGPEEPIYIGRTPPTPEQLKLYFALGARGSFDDGMAYAAANGIDKDFAMNACFQSAVYKPAFMRMWILFPELTEALIMRSVDDRRDYEAIDPEIFVAYSLMSKLVDASDYRVTKQDGTVDNWSLCH